MKRKIIVMFLILFLIIGITGCSKFAKFKPGVTYDNLIEPNGKDGIVYGAVYLPGNRLKLRDIHLKNLDTGKIYGIDYVVRRTAKNIGQSYYIANIPPGKYFFYKMIASGKKRKRYRSTTLNYAYGVFNEGIGKVFTVKKNQATYVGNYFFAKMSALNTLSKFVPDKQIYNVINNHEEQEILIADIYISDKHREFMKYWMIKKLINEKSGTAWLPILEKSVIGYEKLDKEIGDSFVKLQSMANSFEAAPKKNVEIVTEKRKRRKLKGLARYCDAFPKGASNENKVVLANDDDFKVIYFKKSFDLLDLPFSDGAAKEIIKRIQSSEKLSPSRMKKLSKLVRVAFAKGDMQLIIVGKKRLIASPTLVPKKIMIIGRTYIGKKYKGSVRLGLDSEGNPTENAY